MDRLISSYVILTTVLVGSLSAAIAEAALRVGSGPTSGPIFVWLGAAALSGIGLAVFALRDLRQLRKEAAAATAAHDRLSRLFDAAPVGLALFDSEGRLEWCNDFCRAVDPGDDLRLAFGFHESGAQPIASSERRLIDGRWIAVRRTELPVGGFIGLISDITEEKEREADLLARADRLQLSLSAAGEWMWETDVLHRVATVIPLRSTIEPAGLDWMVGHHLADLAPEAGGQAALAACLRDMDARHSFDNAIVRFHDGGRPRDVRLSGMPVFDEPEIFLGYRGVGAFLSEMVPDGSAAELHEEEFFATDPAGNAGPLIEDMPAAAAGMPRLLVVEDSQTNRLLAGAILRRMGYEADLVENGRQAIAAVRKADYGAVLMDVLMPEMDGLEATAKIRALPAPKNKIPIVAMTAHVDARDRQRCFDAGMDEHLAKPINRRHLAAVLRDLVGEGGRPPSTTPAPGGTPKAAKAAKAAEVDDAVIEQLKTDAGPQIVAELILTYMAETDERLARMGVAVAEGRLEDIAGDAHAMKSSSGTFGAIQLQMLAARIEAASTNGEQEEVKALLTDLPALVSKTWRAFASRGFASDGAD